MNKPAGYDISKFVRGQSDCRKGVPHKAGLGESYDAGYAAEYELEQINDNRSLRHGAGKTKSPA